MAEVQGRALEEVRGVRVAAVWKAGRLAASLTRTTDGISFAYRPDYLADDLPAVATTLPLTDQARLTTGGAVPPFFAGLLPEGRRLSSLRRSVKTSADDELSLLLAVGSNPVGDVQIVREGADPARAVPLITVDRSFDEVNFGDVLAEAGIVDPVALPGVQDKASARMISLPLRQAGQRYILKVDPPECPHLAENESFFLQLAKTSGLTVAESAVVHDSTGRPGLLVRRFDRISTTGGETTPVAVEDACQLLDRWPADKYNVSSEEVVAGVARVCAAQAVAIRDVFHQLCFAWLTGNGDVHAKNVSVLATSTGEWRVSPAYDVLSTAAYGDSTLALSIQRKTSGLSRRQLLTFAQSIGLREKAAVSVLDAVLDATVDLESQIGEWVVPFVAAQLKDMVRLIRFRRRAALTRDR